MHAAAGMTALRHGPKDLVENLERHAELIDLPRIGTDDNFAMPNMQLNIAPASPAGSGTPPSIISVAHDLHIIQTIPSLHQSEYSVAIT
jgi:hypothetical protein